MSGVHVCTAQDRGKMGGRIFFQSLEYEKFPHNTTDHYLSKEPRDQPQFSSAASIQGGTQILQYHGELKLHK